MQCPPPLPPPSSGAPAMPDLVFTMDPISEDKNAPGSASGSESSASEDVSSSGLGAGGGGGGEVVHHLTEFGGSHHHQMVSSSAAAAVTTQSGFPGSHGKIERRGTIAVDFLWHVCY
jgi:hypothetical protein